jgi:hypothetical protein
LRRDPWHFAHSIHGVLCCLYFVEISLGSPDISNRSKEPMPRYYFHYRDRSSLFKDEIGEIFADAASALQHARRIALELVRGGEPTNALIIVAEGDQQIYEVPLSEQRN